MNPIAALRGRGAEGLPPAAPLDFAALTLPRSPNTCLAAPAGDPLPAQVRTPHFAAPPEALFDALRAVAAAEPRTHRLAAWPALRQAQWVERSALMNYPDIIAAEVLAAPGGSALRLYSRSLIGWSDLGVNAKRVARWLAALEARLGGGSAPSPLAARLAEGAPGRHVLVMGEAAGEAPALVLAAAAAGAASARALSRQRPVDPDAELAAAGARLGLPTLAAALLARGRVGAADAPPAAFADSEAPPAWWLRERLDAPDLAARLGAVDLVVEPRGLETLAEPARRLAELRGTGATRLLLLTAALPEGCAPGFAADTLWHAGTLDAVRAASLAAALDALGQPLAQFHAAPGKLTPELAATLDAPWWWFMGEAALLGLLTDAGWAGRVVAREGAFVTVAAEAA
jgi:uncharacterized protein (DUF1499 family)